MDSDKNHNTLIIKVYDHFKLNIKQWIDGELTDISKWLGLGCSIAEFVEKYDELKGYQKKEMVITTIKKLINDKEVIVELTEEERNNITKIITVTLPPTIDILVNASNGNYNINSKCKKCFKSCFG